MSKSLTDLGRSKDNISERKGSNRRFLQAIEARRFVSIVDAISLELTGHTNWDELYSGHVKQVEEILGEDIAEVIVFYKNERDET